jgi:hypothetical protein
MVYSNKLPIVPKHHDLIPRISAFFRIFPVIDCYFCSLRAILARDVKYPTPRNVLPLAQTLLAYAAGAVCVRVGRDGPGAEPRIQAARSDDVIRTTNDGFYQASPPRLDRENGFTRKDICRVVVGW